MALGSQQNCCGIVSCQPAAILENFGTGRYWADFCRDPEALPWYDVISRPTTDSSAAFALPKTMIPTSGLLRGSGKLCVALCADTTSQGTWPNIRFPQRISKDRSFAHRAEQRLRSNLLILRCWAILTLGLHGWEQEMSLYFWSRIRRSTCLFIPRHLKGSTEHYFRTHNLVQGMRFGALYLCRN